MDSHVDVVREAPRRISHAWGHSQCLVNMRELPCSAPTRAPHPSFVLLLLFVITSPLKALLSQSPRTLHSPPLYEIHRPEGSLPFRAQPPQTNATRTFNGRSNRIHGPDLRYPRKSPPARFDHGHPRFETTVITSPLKALLSQSPRTLHFPYGGCELLGIC